MGWEDRRYQNAEEGGGLRRALRRIFVEGDNFFSWAFPLFTVFRIRVKVHLLFVLMIISELVSSRGANSLGTVYVALGLASLFLIVLLHEFGHCFACRWVGGEANEVLLWPLGGLAFCLPPHRWKAAFITTVGGPAVNVILVPVLGVLVLSLIRWDWSLLLFNPFDPGRVLANLNTEWKVSLWWCYYTNLALLTFNLVMPMFPLDGARMVQELLWARIGYRRSMVIAVNVGLFVAVAVAVLSLTANNSRMLGLALFGGITCFFEKRKLAVYEDNGLPPGYDFSRGYQGLPPEQPSRNREPGKRELRQRQRAQELNAEVDRILAKIAATGMGSLTRREKSVLRGETHRKRQDEPRMR
jgi:Zn-dependent protease